MTTTIITTTTTTPEEAKVQEYLAIHAQIEELKNQKKALEAKLKLLFDDVAIELLEHPHSNIILRETTSYKANDLSQSGYKRLIEIMNTSGADVRMSVNASHLKSQLDKIDSQVRDHLVKEKLLIVERTSKIEVL